MALDYVDINKKSGKGSYDTVYLAPKDWFATIGTVGTVGAGASMEITTDHTFTVGKGFVKIYATDGSISLTTETVGAKDSRGVKNTLSFRVPGEDKELLEFANESVKDEMIILVKECGGTVRQLGNDCRGAELFSAFASGDKEGAKEHTFTAEIYSPAPVYSGAITPKP